MLSALLTLLVVGVVGIVVLGVVMALIGLAIGITTFLLFKVVPILLVGWVVLKLVNRASRPRARLTAADQRWLDG